MKYIFFACLLLLSGCQTIQNVSSLLPRDHDPTLAGAFIETKIEINTLKCETKDHPLEYTLWTAARTSSNYLREYASFRKDPQQESADAVNTNLKKAHEAEKLSVCNHWLKLAKIRLQVLEKAWGSR